MTLHFGAPQIIWLCLAVVVLVGAGFLHGKPKTGRHNALVTLISSTLEFLLLYWGGFFRG